MPGRQKILISKDGPYQVSGSVPVAVQTIGTDRRGQSTKWIQGGSFPASETCSLCRCGESRAKPFCDGTHEKIGFDGTETATEKSVMEQSEILDGPDMQLADAEELCAYARFCDPNGRIWNQVERTDNPKVRAHFVQQAGDCPAGRLIAIEKATGKAVEPKLSRAIGVVEDPANGCSGPLWVQGGIQVTGADGREYEVRNRLTLCRCGRSENKPFCNGSHASEPKFEDGIG